MLYLFAQLFVIVALVAAAQAVPPTYVAAPLAKYAAVPTLYNGAPVVAPVGSIEEYDPALSSYSYAYSVDDPITGDVKSQHETRSGNSVVGQYSLIDSDGTKRTVDYSADDHNGFNAVVRKDPIGAVPVAAVPAVAAKFLAAPAPVAYSAPAPVAYSPPAPVAYSAPAPAPLAIHAGPTPIAYHAAPAPIAYHAVPHTPVAYSAAHGLPVSYASVASPAVKYATSVIAA